ncbi:CDK-activating kinase assembly factor MAT1 [Chlorella sorokiniana]|uniref:CDK-activating kinase assembly factor MAT1 n=1 Tax=Chlorella sorokiniana TaxID=3076 RepID=A0A2P6TPS5_CHLSO|nr:CDK-activating kinase assembly factor MAT1 [Chlorella sorokiniana]|eukprot:PRW56035.1 CDK-activating kinase assembly factor MAT1 [Chlorella sorokiniana]
MVLSPATQALRKEMKIRARVEAIFNKHEDEFDNKQEYDDYLEEREDIIFNLSEGVDVAEMERKVEQYRLANTESIIRNEARRAEELRRKAAAGEEGAGHAGISGTAAAFAEGADAEPHQGMEYTAAMPEAAAAAVLGMGPAPVPLSSVATDAAGNLQAAAGGAQLSSDAWRTMALASGWRPEFPKRKALEQAFGSVLVF